MEKIATLATRKGSLGHRAEARGAAAAVGFEVNKPETPAQHRGFVVMTTVVQRIQQVELLSIQRAITHPVPEQLHCHCLAEIDADILHSLCWRLMSVQASGK